MQQYHFVGVAGVGMSALVQAVLAQGHAVSGSDRCLDKGENSETLNKLKSAGVRLFPQDGSAVTAKTAGVVVSTAIESDNPDIAAAHRHNAPIIHRAEMLARLIGDKRCVAITGTSGKSTVTGMIGWILDQLGADPIVVNGAPVLNWRNDATIGNVRVGKSGLWVIEADESDRSLMQFHPEWAIITNVSRDHFDLRETTELFDKFSAQVENRVLRGEEILANFKPDVSAMRSDFTYKGVGFRINLPGRHNAENAICAVAMCETIGFGLEEISRALATFKGIERRLEVVGTAKGVTIIDDYAHNPAKIRAAFEAICPYHERVIAIWRPHGFKPLSQMMTELVEMFSETCRQSDRLYVLPVYDAGGTADRSVNSDVLVAKLRERRIPVELVPDPAQIVGRVLSDNVRGGDVIITMGARDPQLPVLAGKILAAIDGVRQDGITNADLCG